MSSILAVILFVIWIMVLINILDSNYGVLGKTLWILGTFFFPIIGVILWLIVGKD